MASKVAADLYFDIKTDLKGLKKGLADAKKEIRASTRAINKSQTDMFKQMKNDTVRAIRQLESLVVAIYGVKKAYDVTIGRGHEFNKMMEAEKIGLSLMIVQKLADVDATGKQISQMEKWGIANKVAAQEMEEVRKINVETPHTLGQTIQLYKVMRGQMLAAREMDASTTVEMVKNLSLVGAAANVEFSSMIKTLDQLLAGNMKPSDMQIALQNLLGITQEEIRAAKAAGNEVEYLMEKLKGAAIAASAVKQSWGGMVSNFLNIWDEIAGEVQKPMFDMMKKELGEMRDYLVENKDLIVDMVFAWAKSFDDLSASLVGVLKLFVELKLAIILINKAIMIGGLSRLAKLLVAAKLAMFGLIASYFMMRKENKSLIDSVDDMVRHFNLGWAVIKVGWAEVVLALAEGMNVFYKAWKMLTGNMEVTWNNMKVYIEKVWADLLNGMIKKLNLLLEGLADFGNMFGKLFNIEFKPLEIDEIVPTGALQKYKAEVEDLINTDQLRIDSLNANMNLVTRYTNVLNNNNGEMKKAVKETKAAVKPNWDLSKTIDKVSDSNKKGAKAAKGATDALKKQDDALKAIAKGLSSASIDRFFEKQVKDAAAALDDLRDKWVDIGDEIGSSLSDAFEDILGGDTTKAFQNLFKDLLKEVTTFAISAIIQFAAMGQQAGILAVLTQGQGDPYTAFARMAAMAAAVAALGVSVAFGGGGGGGISQAQMDIAQGKDTVLSDSAENALEAIRDNGVEGLEYSRRMADSLDIMVRQSNKASASLGDTLSGREYNPRNKDTLWGGTQREMVSTGIMINPASIDDFANANLTGWEYLTEKVTKSSWFGLSSKESLSTQSLGDADASFMQAYAEAFNSGVDAMRDAAEVLGVTKDQFTQFTSEWEMLSQNLNFEGLDADERTELIIQSLSGNLDSLAATITPLVGYVDEFKQGGEKFAKTVLRLANEFEVVERAMTNLGISMPAVANGGVAVSQAFINIFGTMERFAGFMNWFTNGFFSEEERLTMATNQLKESFAQLGMTMPTTREGMKALILLKLAEIKTITQQIEAQKALIEAQIAGSKITIEKAKVEGITAEAAAKAAMVAGAGAMVAAGAAAEAVAILEQLETTLEGLKEFISTIDANMGNIDLVFDTGSFESASDSASALGSSVGNLGSSCSSAASSVENLSASLTGIASITATWIGGLEGAKITLAAVIAETQLLGVTFENFLAKFNAAVEAGMTEADLTQWSQLSSALQAVEAEEARIEAEKRQKELDWLNEQLSFYENLIKTIQDAYQGSLSYLNSIEKANYAAQQAADAIEAGNTQEYINQLGKQLEAEKKISPFKEDYVLEFESYITELRKQKPEQTLDDVVDELVQIKEEIDEVKDAIRGSSYQKEEV